MVHESQFTDEDGRPTGGQTWGRGFAIAWQRGPLGRGETREEPNGAFVEDIIAAALGRLRHYETSAFRCAENREAINYLQAALTSLDRRTKRREADGTEGTWQGS